MTVVRLYRDDPVVDLAYRENAVELGRRLGGVSTRTIRRWCEQGMPCEVIAQRRVFIPEDAIAWLVKNGLIERRGEWGTDGQNTG